MSGVNCECVKYVMSIIHFEQCFVKSVHFSLPVHYIRFNKFKDVDIKSCSLVVDQPIRRISGLMVENILDGMLLLLNGILTIEKGKSFLLSKKLRENCLLLKDISRSNDETSMLFFSTNSGGYISLQ